VSPFGSDTPPYDTYAKAAHKVADAVLAASGYGDTVLVHTGIYNFDTTIHIPAGLTWAGVGRDSVVLNWARSDSYPGLISLLLGDNEVYGLEFNYPYGSSHNYSITGAFSYASTPVTVHDCRFRELALNAGEGGLFEVYNCDFAFGRADGIYYGGSHTWIHNNRFRGTQGGSGVFLSWASGVLIEHNTFDTDASRGAYTGVYQHDCGTITVRNNLILNSFQPVSWYYASGVVENNTMVRADCDWEGMGVFLKPYQTLVIRNNVMQDFARLPQFGNECLPCDTTGRITYMYNAFWPPEDSFHLIWKYTVPSKVKLVDSANFNAFPMFTTDSSFQLQYASPLVDAGDPSVKDADSSRSDIGWWGGSGGSTYVYPDLPPTAPKSLKYDYAYPNVSLWWDANHETDLQNYAVHCDAHSGFEPTVGNRVGTSPASDTTFTDSLHDSLTGAYYKVVAVDATAHESPPSNEVAVIPTGVFDADDPGAPLPRTPRLLGNYPNPFNSSTVFALYIPAVGASPAPVEIIIYDALGRRATVAFQGELPPGTHQIAWNGSDSAGHPLASGVYFARLKFWSLTLKESVKVVIVR
jgi:hypothetical protein